MLNAKDEDGVSRFSELYAAGSDTLYEFVLAFARRENNGALRNPVVSFPITMVK